MASGTWRLGHRPALDGLRGIAVLLVVVGHLARGGAIDWLSGAGVDIFFVLSGFLITALLLEELGRTGRLSLSAFYQRRARRLGPALVAVVAFVAVTSLFVDHYANWALLGGALTWSANWVKIAQLHHGLAGGSDYGTPLGHTWSLAVEEQFYLLWPLVLVALARLGRRTMVVCTALGVAASAALAYLVDDPFQVYYGSGTRAMPLLVGCLLAMWLHGRAEGRSQAAGAGLALVWIVIITWTPPFQPTVAGHLVALLTAVVIWGIAQGRESSFLDASWLRLVGQRSYALYLWHWPIYVLIGHTISGSAWALALLGIPAAWAMTLLSWRFVERPFVAAGTRRVQPLTHPHARARQTTGGASASCAGAAASHA